MSWCLKGIWVNIINPAHLAHNAFKNYDLTEIVVEFSAKINKLVPH